MIAGVALLGAVLSVYYQRSTYTEMYGRLGFSSFGGAEEVSHYDYGNAALVALIAALALSEFERNYKRQVLALSCAMLLGISIILTLGRSLAVELGIASLVWATFGAARASRPLKLVCISLLASVGLFVALSINEGALDARWGITRVAAEEDNLLGLTSGRAPIWEAGYRIFSEEPMRGIGLGDFQQEYADVSEAGMRRGAHNAFVMFAAETGILGPILFAIALIAFGLQAWKAGPWRHITMAWWVYFIMEVNAHGIGRHKAFWLAAGLSVALGRLVSEARPARARDAVTPRTRRPLQRRPEGVPNLGGTTQNLSVERGQG
jgi:O-antigen ligase